MKNLILHKINQLAAALDRKSLKPVNFISAGKRPTLISVAAMVLLFCAAGLYFTTSPELRKTPFAKLTNRVSSSRVFTLTASLPGSPLQTKASYPPLFFAGHNEEEPMVPQAVVEFLKTYSLLKFENAFYDALRFRQFERVAEEIYRSTGYELIRLDHAPEFIKDSYEILSYTLGARGEEAFFLFWRPLFKMDKFYYTYKGHEILFLQRKLADLDLYDQRIDGIVGPELLYAVVQFQKMMALQVTGFPDPSTVFLICQLASKPQNNPELKISAQNSIFP